MKKILISLTALMLAAAMTVPAFAEDASAGTADTASALSEAQDAYNTAKRAADLTDYEAELNAMVAAGSLTQEQADLLLTAARESAALSSGVCPSCGYVFQYTATASGSHGFGKSFGRTGRLQTSASASGDSTALEQAQEAYNTAKQASDLTDYEARLKTMVEAGTLTQEQADLLLAAAKETASLSAGVCPSCGYQFQTTTVVTNGRGSGKGRGGKH